MRIIVFTGAGISRESGLRTFRDAGDGLWEGYRIEEVASLKGWWDDPAKVLDFYNMRRREVRAAEPNAAHLALAALEAKHDVTVITQNVDDLHERAGSSRVLHLHGEVLKARPDAEGGTPVRWEDDLVLGDRDPATGAQMRPHVVWFGEGLPDWPEAFEIATHPEVDVLLVVGTTLEVYPAAMIATETAAPQVFLVDPSPPVLIHPNVERLAVPATVGVPTVVQRLLG